VSICASGASTTKPGVNTTVVVTADYVKSLLPSGWSWLYDYLPYLQALTIGDVPTFCSLDPPTWSIPTPTDFYNFFTGGYLTQSNVVTTFLNNLTKMYLWYSLCQCTSGSTPTPAAPSSAPANLPAINPVGVVTYPTTTPCAIFSTTDTGFHGVSDWRTEFPVKDTVFNTVVLGTLPIGCTTTQIHMSVSSASPNPPNPWTLNMSFYGAAGITNSLGGTTLSVASGASGTVLVPTKAGAVFYYIWAQISGNAGVLYGNTLTIGAELYCGGGPGATQSPCCPPDQIATGMLAQILAAVTLTQRQAAPFAYIATTVHAGITGSGTLAVQGLIGLKIDITTAPGRLGAVAGDPITLYEAGWVNIGTADGFGPRQFISSDPTLILPISGAATLIGYSIPSDVVVSITELVREP
jgi:hypothetical protein